MSTLFHKSFLSFFICALIFSIFCNSCNKDTYTEEVDTIRGIWGQAILYNEWGSPEADNSDISIKVSCIDTLNSDTSNLSIWDTSYYITTDIKGNWELNKPVGGWYFMEFSKDGYCKNTLYAHYYDTSYADTLDAFYLTKASYGSIEIDSVTIKDDVLSIYRNLYFTSQTSSSYSLSTWYFFDTVETVSDTQYTYSYVSGSATSVGDSHQKLTVYKPVDKLLEAGIKTGSTVYVRAYVDNARAVSYRTGENTWVYPNLSAGSNVISFVIPDSDEE